MLSLGLSLPSVATLSQGVPVPPSGFVFVTDDLDGAYLVDGGAYLIAEA